MIGVWPILVAYLLVRAFWLTLDQTVRSLDSILAPGLLKIALWVVPCLAVTMAVNRLGPRAVLREFGLEQRPGAGVAFGILATLPLAAAVLFVGTQHPGIAELFAVSVLDPIGESVLFSGFLFSQLRRWNWRVTSAVMASALLFGVAHLDGLELRVAATLYRETPGFGFELVWSQLRSFFPALIGGSAGGVLLTWLFHRWDMLWPTIAFHAAINFWWTISADLGLGFGQSIWRPPSATAIAHGVSMVIAIVATLVLTRRQVSPSRPEGSYDLTRTV